MAETRGCRGATRPGALSGICHPPAGPGLAGRVRPIAPQSLNRSSSDGGGGVMSSPTPPSAASAILSSYLTQLRLPTMAASCAAVAREAAASNLDYLAFLTVRCGQEVAQREQTQAA